MVSKCVGRPISGLGFELVEFSEDIRDGDADFGVGDGEFDGRRLESTIGVCLIGTAAAGIDDPNGGYAHGEVIFDALLDFTHAVVAGEDFNAE